MHSQLCLLRGTKITEKVSKEPKNKNRIAQKIQYSVKENMKSFSLGNQLDVCKLEFTLSEARSVRSIYFS